MHGDPIGYFLTWVTYGTWLPGDARGWVEYRHGWQLPDPIREQEANARMTEDACRLAPAQRQAVEAQIAETCRHRGWTLHAVNCRSNHIHVVVTADVAQPKKIRIDLKAWATRILKNNSDTPTRSVSEELVATSPPTRSVSEGRAATPTRSVSEGEFSEVSHLNGRENWWAERGSIRYLNDEDELEAAILYVQDGQDAAR